MLLSLLIIPFFFSGPPESEPEEPANPSAPTNPSARELALDTARDGVRVWGNGEACREQRVGAREDGRDQKGRGG